MNQILDYNPNSGPRNQGGRSDVIVRVFAIILIIFAIALISIVVYGRFSNEKQVDTLKEEVTEANIDVTVEGTTAMITVTHDKNISKLIYSWNTSSEKRINGEGKLMEQAIEVPAGNNTLHIKVIDEKGNETTYDEEITAEEGTDIINPVIELAPAEGNSNMWIITAKDETAIDFITYRWNEDAEETVYAEEGSKELSVEVEIPMGKNDLTVIAVDTSKNVSNEQKSFKGVVKPNISVTLAEDGSSIDIHVDHESGLKSVNLNLNDVDYGWNYDEASGEEAPQTLQFTQGLEVGYNRIIVTAKSIDDTENKFDCYYNYGVASEEGAQDG